MVSKTATLAEFLLTLVEVIFRLRYQNLHRLIKIFHMNYGGEACKTYISIGYKSPAEERPQWRARATAEVTLE
jgi:hypothetical protein